MAQSFSGIGNLPSGVHNEDLKISGILKADSDIECKSLRVSGLLKARSNVYVQEHFSDSGASKIQGYLQVDQDISCSGLLNVQDQLYSHGALRASGCIKCGGDLSAIRGMKISGIVKTRGVLHSESDVRVTGKLTVKSNLMARNFIVESRSLDSFIRFQAEIYGNVVVGEQVNIENTKVKGSIHGHDVYIGKNCEIEGPIYYRGNVEIHPSARVSIKPEKIY